MLLQVTCRQCHGDGKMGAGKMSCVACDGSGIIESPIDFDGPSLQDVLDKCNDIETKVNEIHTIVSAL